MIYRLRDNLVLVIAVVLSLSLLVANADEGKSFKQENKPENLKMFLELIHQTIHIKKDLKQAVVLYRSLIPDQDRVKKAFRDNVGPEVIEKIMAMHKEFGPINEAAISQLASEEQKVVAVHGATTEEIALYKEDSVPFYKFPGGTKQVAQQLLGPNMMFFEAEFLRPGSRAGIKYHLFYWDGKQWTMLGPVWRALR
jgi:hypothetical protein